MPKTDAEKLEDRLAEINRLVEEKVKIEDRLKILTGMKQPPKPSPKPEGFALMQEIEKALRRDGALTAKEVAESIKKAWNGFDPDVKKVRSTAVYMRQRNIISIGADRKLSLL